jgi:DNA-binding NtrC family response regulator
VIQFGWEPVISTLKQSGLRGGAEEPGGPPIPGLILIHSGTQALWSVLRLTNGELELGRDALAPRVQDARISRRHARVFLSAGDGRILAEDLGSLNGSSVDGRPLSAQGEEPIERCLRIGDTLFLVARDVRPFERNGLTVRGERVIGPRLAAAYLGIARFARSSSTLHLTGESGVGKEDAARSFHAATPKSAGPFIAVNCATIPESIAERLLFGTRRGAFSGATEDAQGHVQAAHGGTLFLDEVAELHSAVQAKLLRVLESREVQALGAVRPVPVDVRICSASHTPLRSHVASGRLREDLYYRIGRPEIRIPPLRERLEEIPWLIQGELRRLEGAPRPHPSFVEACLLRPWPGNIRELLVEVRAAAQEALAEGSPRIEARHLGAAAGQLIAIGKPAPVQSPPDTGSGSAQAEDSGSAPAEPSPSEDSNAPSPPPPGASGAAALTRAEVESVLQRTGGNVSRAARALGVQRNTLRRFLERHQIDPAALSGIIAPARKRSP